MPLLFLERFPWPSLRTYAALSGLALLAAVLSARRALVAAGEQRAGGPRALDVAYYLLSDGLCVWVSRAAGGAAAGCGRCRRAAPGRRLRLLGVPPGRVRVSRKKRGEPPARGQAYVTAEPRGAQRRALPGSLPGSLPSLPPGAGREIRR